VIKNDDTIARKPDDFEVSWVFGNILPALRRQLVTFWLREGALTNPDEAWRRSWEVACVLRQVANGSIAGACTVAIRLDDQGHAYGFIRIFIRPGSRLAGLNVRSKDWPTNKARLAACLPPSRIANSSDARSSKFSPAWDLSTLDERPTVS
jgi:hypothetical protein